MSRLILYLAIAYIIWQLARGWARKAGSPPNPPPLERRSEQPLRPPRTNATDIDYTRVKEAKFKDKHD